MCASVGNFYDSAQENDFSDNEQMDDRGIPVYAQTSWLSRIANICFLLISPLSSEACLLSRQYNPLLWSEAAYWKAEKLLGEGKQHESAALSSMSRLKCRISIACEPPLAVAFAVLLVSSADADVVHWQVALQGGSMQNSSMIDIAVHIRAKGEANRPLRI